MPFYCFKCPACGEQKTELRTMADSDKPVLCPNDGFIMNRDFPAEHTRSAACSSTFWSDTMGVHPEQVEEERKLHPDWTFNDDGRVLIEGLADQRKKCKALGMVNKDDNV